MMDERQEMLWNVIMRNCSTVEDAVRFFVGYCGLQILDDEMEEFLKRIEWIDKEEN